MMHETALLAETAIFYPALFNELRLLTPIPTPTMETICCAAVSASLEQDAKAIIVITTTYTSSSCTWANRTAATQPGSAPNIARPCRFSPSPETREPVAHAIFTVASTPFSTKSPEPEIPISGKKTSTQEFVGE
jgi:hypothetical protein